VGVRHNYPSHFPAIPNGGTERGPGRDYRGALIGFRARRSICSCPTVWAVRSALDSPETADVYVLRGAHWPALKARPAPSPPLRGGAVLCVSRR
jgi:hypothetical protein